MFLRAGAGIGRWLASKGHREFGVLMAPLRIGGGGGLLGPGCEAESQALRICRDQLEGVRAPAISLDAKNFAQLICFPSFEQLNYYFTEPILLEPTITYLREL
jgi:hypothetical protein